MQNHENKTGSGSGHADVTSWGDTISDSQFKSLSAQDYSHLSESQIKNLSPENRKIVEQSMSGQGFGSQQRTPEPG